MENPKVNSQEMPNKPFPIFQTWGTVWLDAILYPSCIIVLFFAFRVFGFSFDTSRALLVQILGMLLGLVMVILALGLGFCLSQDMLSMPEPWWKRAAGCLLLLALGVAAWITGRVPFLDRVGSEVPADEQLDFSFQAFILLSIGAVLFVLPRIKKKPWEIRTPEPVPQESPGFSVTVRFGDSGVESVAMEGCNPYPAIEKLSDSSALKEMAEAGTIESVQMTGTESAILTGQYIPVTSQRLDALLSQLQASCFSERLRAISGLEDLGDEKAIPALEKLANYGVENIKVLFDEGQRRRMKIAYPSGIIPALDEEMLWPSLRPREDELKDAAKRAIGSIRQDHGRRES